MQVHNKGFSLLEMMVSLMIVAVSVFMLASILTVSLHSGKRSSIRLQLDQVYDGYQNRLISQSFESELLLPGKHDSDEEPFEIRWHTQDLSETLKKINLAVSYRNQTEKRGYFYKSRFIKEVRQ